MYDTRSDVATRSLNDSALQPLDLAEMRRQLGEDEELVSDLMALFLSDYLGRLESLTAALDARDADGVRSVAHTIKGGASNLCARGVTDAARALEVVCAHEDFAAIREHADRLAAEVERLAGALRGFQRERPDDATDTIRGSAL